MSISPTSALTTAAILAKKPADPKVGPVRGTAANILRGMGDGADSGYDQIGVMADKGYIYPIEGAYAVKKVVDATVGKAPVVGKPIAWVANSAAFITGFDGMIISSMMRAPGQLYGQVAYSAADHIDGKHTAATAFGGLASLAAAPQPAPENTQA